MLCNARTQSLYINYTLLSSRRMHFNNLWLLLVLINFGDEHLFPSFFGQSERKIKKNTKPLFKTSIFWKNGFSYVSVKRKFDFSCCEISPCGGGLGGPRSPTSTPPPLPPRKYSVKETLPSEVKRFGPCSFQRLPVLFFRKLLEFQTDSLKMKFRNF